METSNFHSTVLQRPSMDEEDERRRHHQHQQHHQPHAPSHAHAILNPAPTSPRLSRGGIGGGPPSVPPPPPLPAVDKPVSNASGGARSASASGFSLRSPDYQRQPPAQFAAPLPYSAQQQPPAGSSISSKYPPPAPPPPPSALAPPGGPSPLHPPSLYYPPQDMSHPQPPPPPPIPPPPPAPSAAVSGSGAGSFYDPTTDITRERRTSDAASASGRASSGGGAQAGTPKFRDPPYDYTRSSPIETPYSVNGSPYKSSAYPQPRSPLSHSHVVPAAGGSLSPPSRPPPLMSSPGLRDPTKSADRDIYIGDGSVRTPSSTVNPFSSSNLQAPSPPSIGPVPSTASTPSRAAGVMSFSNILSNPEPAPKSRLPTTLDEFDKELEKRVKPVRKGPHFGPGSRPIIKREGEGVIRTGFRRAPRKKVDSAPPKPMPPARTSTKRQLNGTPKLPRVRGFSLDSERKILALMDEIDGNPDDASEAEPDADKQLWLQRTKRRRIEATTVEGEQRELRRLNFADAFSKKLTSQAEFGKKRFDDAYYDEALGEVREQEVFAEKERKKDMQRKRRREKSMAVTIEQKELALARAMAAEDEAERAKHLKEAERANKKAQQTKLILQKGIKGPARNVVPMGVNLEGGVMSSFPATEPEPGKGKKGRGGPRLKKSKEQKQAEKESAEAAQAAIDAGYELPSKEESQKTRIKLTKSSSQIKTDPEAKDSNKENEPAETPEPSEVKVREKERQKSPPGPEARFQTKGYNQIYDQIWRDLSRKDVTKVFKMASDSYATKSSNLKKTAILASKEAKRWQLRTNKGTKDLQARAKRVMREMMGFWKRNEREERDLRKAAEKQELENLRKEEADREAARQKRKLNFLISQTELYSHFIGKKIKTSEVERSTDHPDVVSQDKDKIPENDLNIDEPVGPVGSKVTHFEDLNFEEEDEETLKAAAISNAQNAIAEAQQKALNFNKAQDLDDEGELNFQNPTGLGNVEIEQPKLLNAQLKEYQLKGLNWLVNLYEQGINGILADEMGLGKTVQSISVMAYLAEKYDVWGPFLVVAPASTLHNWQQEIARFVPEFKVLPYWGTAGDRKVLRKFWDRKHSTYKKESDFHVLVTSYQLVVSDVAYFQKMRWQYMILDEAQAIKSSQSSRWKCLLGFHCRNRLLLTGTPIQNNMQELWALLHFIMPSLFDSHDEFSEWFSKDIESHAQSHTKLNEDQLKRLHMILKPFMLRRVKKHVQKELGDKIELDVFCNLTYRQRAYYVNLRNQISIMDLIEKATLGDDNDSGTLMNLVMQFRKVCNHPDLFERADTTSPYSLGYFAETASFVREGNNITVVYSARSAIEYTLPRLIWQEDGRLYKASETNQRAGWRNKYLDHMMNIWTPENVQDSLGDSDSFTWLRFADVSLQEVYQVSHQDVFTRAVALSQKPDRLGYMNVAYDESEDENFTPAHALFQIRARKNRQPLIDVTSEGILAKLMNISRVEWRDKGFSRLEPAGRPGATAPPIDVLCCGQGSNAERENVMFNAPMRRALFGPNIEEEKALVLQNVPLQNYPTPALLPPPDNVKRKFTNVAVPSMRRFVTDSGKLAKLDDLLIKLKEGGHRVLLYFQMTRMIDLMEEYLTYRNYKYLRLDGSTKLEDRRDTVHDFQTRPEYFIFLLSTRAGGLGINLTSADTVIFYDSDWNPTIDSQAMDRAHRLGQTKQVTVYRLITRGTIEERIRKRALQKEEVQRVVIQGGGASVDFSGRRAPENRNRDIAMWLADDEQAELIERREKELLESGEFDKATKKRGKRSKRETGAVSLDEMYHEGEGHFDDGNANKPSGTSTPVDGDAGGGVDAKGSGLTGRKRRGGAAAGGGSKRAKSAKQRLAIADGSADV